MNYFIAHLIGDFLLQNDRVALSKKESTLACFVHCCTYMIPFFFLCTPNILNDYAVHAAWWQFALVFAQHFAIDRTGFVAWFCEWKGSARFIKEPLWPWSLIVIDQVLHLTWLYLVFEVMA